MKKYLFLISCLSLMASAATTFVGCGEDDELWDNYSNPTELTMHEWKLDYIKDGVKKKKCPLPNYSTAYTIKFDSEKRFEVRVACYYFEGNYTADSVNIRMYETFSSEMEKYLRPDSLARHWKYDNLLEKTILECNKYAISGNHLRLYSNHDYIQLKIK